MKKGWTTTKLIAAAGLGVLTIVLQLFGSSLTLITNIPLASAIINIIVAPTMMVFCLLVVDQFGAVATMYIVAGVLSLPLPLGGTPGFLPKVPIAIIEGIIADVLYFLLRRNRRIAPLVIGGATMLYAGVATVEVGYLFNLPGIEQTAKVVYSPLVIFVLLVGAVGGYIGYLLFQKLKNTAVVRRIQG